MFLTELEAIENGFMLTVTYDVYRKVWFYPYLIDLRDHRSRLERYFTDKDFDTLQEEML